MRNFLDGLCKFVFGDLNVSPKVNVRDRMLRIKKMDSKISPVPPRFELEFLASKPYKFSRVETISLRPKPLHF